MNEPLKKKILLCDLCADCRLAPKQGSYVFEKEDVQSAVQWLKESIKNLRFNKEMLDSIINEAFADVIEDKEWVESDEYKKVRREVDFHAGRVILVHKNDSQALDRGVKEE